MSPSVPIAMFGWIPLLLAMFAFLPARRAVLAGFVAGSLFLPVASYTIAGLPDYTKVLAICLGVAAAATLFDFRTVVALRPTWVDLPLLLFCFTPFLSAMNAGFGVHEGLSVILNQVITWGIPYALGVVYLRSFTGLREFAIAIFAGGLIYVPLCIYEMVKGPRLSLIIYGFAQQSLDPATMRFGGWRPTVFMNAGLMVAVWMAAASVCGIWLCKTRVLSRFHGIPPIWFVSILVGTTIWVKSVNGWLLLLFGSAILFVASRLRSRALVYSLPLMIVAYVTASAMGLWSRAEIIPMITAVLNAERAQSISYRFINEKVIAENARQHALLGWGRTTTAFADRSRVIIPNGDKTKPAYAVIDSLWIGVYGMFGAVGLAGLLGSLLLPTVLFFRRFSPARWQEAQIAPAAALAVVLIMYTVDNLANGFIQPVFMLAAGGLAHLTPLPAE